MTILGSGQRRKLPEKQTPLLRSERAGEEKRKHPEYITEYIMLAVPISIICFFFLKSWRNYMEVMRRKTVAQANADESDNIILIV